jgi:hypothetical protein
MSAFRFLGARQAQLDVGALLRRLLDKSVSRVPPGIDEARSVSRCTRVFPVFLVPWMDGAPNPNDAVFATTSEVSDYGMSVVLSFPLQEPDVVVGMLVERKPYLLLGRIKRCRPMGGGFWQLGIQALEILEPTEPSLKKLLKLAAVLSPRAWKRQLQTTTE